MLYLLGLLECKSEKIGKETTTFCGRREGLKNLTETENDWLTMAGNSTTYKYDYEDYDYPDDYDYFENYYEK